jgi:DNA gyrase subunit A
VGIKGADAKEGDVLKSLFVASTHDNILCFTNMGQVLWLKVYNLPEATRTSKGRSITNLLSLRDGEDVTSLLRVPEFDDEMEIVQTVTSGATEQVNAVVSAEEILHFRDLIRHDQEKQEKLAALRVAIDMGRQSGASNSSMSDVLREVQADISNEV